MKLLFDVSGVVRAPLERVRERMFRDAGESGSHRLVDRDQGVIAYWGDWAPYLVNKLFIGYRARLEESMWQRVA